MVPDFNEFGYLPFGIHPCSLKELVGRFGCGSPEREVETQELNELVEWARNAGVVRLIVNGSYVTAKIAPNDVDVVVLPGGDYPRQEAPWSQLETRWPFLQVFVAADELDLEAWAFQDFGTDRNRLPKGVVEIKL